MRHLRVDLTGQLDELGVHANSTSSPRQVKRVNRNAVSAQSRAGKERLVTERFGSCCLNDFPDIDVHRLEHDFQFVDQGDIDRSIGVFKDLARLSNARVADGYDLLDHVGIEVNREIAASFIDAANDFWNRA